MANRLTSSGRHFDNAVSKLRELKLADIAAESRANELGQAIRDHLIRPFKAPGPAQAGASRRVATTAML